MVCGILLSLCDCHDYHTVPPTKMSNNQIKEFAGNLGNHGNAVCLRIKGQIISVKFIFSNICELKTYNTRKKI